MTCNPTFKFGGVDHFSDSQPLHRIEINLQQFIDWAFLCIGAWSDIKRGFPGPAGEDLSRLHPVEKTPGYNSGQVWQCARQNWVHESITYTDSDLNSHSPLMPLVYVDNLLVSGSTYNVDYLGGRIVFDTAISTSSEVEVECSVKNVRVLVGHDVPWWRELQLNSWNVDENFFQQQCCGQWIMNGRHRVQLPCIIIEGIDGGSTNPLGLGDNRREWVERINLHVLSDIKCERQNITDILVRQDQQCHSLFDPDSALFALDCNGFPEPSGLTLPDLVSNYSWACGRVSEAESTGFSDIEVGLFEGVITWTYSVFL